VPRGQPVARPAMASPDVSAAYAPEVTRRLSTVPRRSVQPTRRSSQRITAPNPARQSAGCPRLARSGSWARSPLAARTPPPLGQRRSRAPSAPGAGVPVQGRGGRRRSPHQTRDAHLFTWRRTEHQARRLLSPVVRDGTSGKQPRLLRQGPHHLEALLRSGHLAQVVTRLMAEFVPGDWPVPTVHARSIGSPRAKENDVGLIRRSPAIRRR